MCFSVWKSLGRPHQSTHQEDEWRKSAGWQHRWGILVLRVVHGNSAGLSDAIIWFSTIEDQIQIWAWASNPKGLILSFVQCRSYWLRKITSCLNHGVNDVTWLLSCGITVLIFYKLLKERDSEKEVVLQLSQFVVWMVSSRWVSNLQSSLLIQLLIMPQALRRYCRIFLPCYSPIF